MKSFVKREEGRTLSVTSGGVVVASVGIENDHGSPVYPFLKG
jgi:hypothetical protein